MTIGGHRPGRGPLLDQRAALLLLMSLLTGLAAGALTFWAHQSAPEAVLAGGAAFGASLALLHQLVG